MNAILRTSRRSPRPDSRRSSSASCSTASRSAPRIGSNRARDLAFDLGYLSGASGRTATPAAAGDEAHALPDARDRPARFRFALLLAFAGGRRFERGARVDHRAPLPESFSQVTDQPGVEAQPSLSPDGKSVAYVGRFSGHDAIYLQRVGGGTALNLTADSKDDDNQPAFSPDGERIAFHSTRAGGGIFVMGTTGESVSARHRLRHRPELVPGRQGDRGSPPWRSWTRTTVPASGRSGRSTS
jgi:hypothetical protein